MQTRMLKSIGLITFDAMHTLISPSGDIGAEYLKIATSFYGLKAPKDDHSLTHQLNVSLARNMSKLSKEFPNYGYDAKLTPAEWWTRLVVSTFVEAGFDQDAERRQLRAIGAHLFRHYSRGSCWKLEEGAHELLSKLRQHKPEMKLAVLSNFDHRLETILRDLGVLHFFSHLFLSSQIGHAKPSRQIFDHVLETTKVEAQDYLHIGDDVDRDYHPVVGFGGKAILIDRKNNHAELKTVKSLSEIIDLL